MISIGIDISKEKSTVCMLRPYGEVIEEKYYKKDSIYKKQKTDISCYDCFAAEYSYKNDADRD